MLVHGSLPNATNSTENYHPQQSTNQRVKANKNITQVTVVSPFQQQNEREKGNVFFIKLRLFSLNDSEIMFLIFGC